ncbi:MAG TPA: multidrug ABC transporter permease [Bacteroidetes bacterium]|nr:multidrug ABC transporter permease [Bacteroidota bacterium]
MKIPFSYNIRNLWTRRLTTALTVTGIALVVFVFAAVLMLAQGVEDTMVATGSEDNVIILRKGSSGELLSAVSRDQIGIISTFPEIAVTNEGKTFGTSDVVTIINLRKKQTNDMGNIIVRGVSAGAITLRSQVTIKEGRWFKQGSTEIVIGNKIHDQFENVEIGQQIQIGSKLWTIVGVADAGKTGFASELWADAENIMQEFNRTTTFSSYTFKLKNIGDYETIKTKLETEQRLQDLEVKKEQQFYLEQSQGMAVFIKALGLVITIIFSFGAMIGAMITMYAAVANRTVEIGTLRALGFRRRSILTAFLIEALALSIVGGIIGLILASFMQFVSFSTTNFGTFSELAFGFSLSLDIIGWTLLFSLIMGVFGGFLPAVRASRMNIINALRAS